MDDGSTDRTVATGREFADPRIRVVADGVHRGLSAQLNRAVQMARGKYLARMDADDMAYPDRLRKQVEFLEAHPEVDLVGAWMAIFRSNGVLLGVRRPPSSHGEICVHPWAGISMAHPTWMGHIGWFRRNHYPTDALRMEDWALLLRTHSRSRFANIQEVLLGYREDSLSIRKQLLARKNVCKFATQYGREHKKLALACRTIAGQAARALLDVAALSTGLGHNLLRYRARPATPLESEDWRKVWTLVASAEAPMYQSSGALMRQGSRKGNS